MPVPTSPCERTVRAGGADYGENVNEPEVGGSTGRLSDVRGSHAALPIDADAVRPVAVGTVLWLIALGVLAFNRDALDAREARSWIWIAATGALLGLLGIAVTRWRRRRQQG
jgi:hypothetical protein